MTDQEMKMIDYYSEVAKKGDAYADAMRNGAIEGLFVLMEKASFEVFKKTNPNEMSEIIEAQMMCKVLGRLRDEISSEIEQSRVARTKIVNINKSLQEKANG